MKLFRIATFCTLICLMASGVFASTTKSNGQPALVSITPSSVNAGQTVTLSVIGTDVNFTTGNVAFIIENTGKKTPGARHYIVSTNAISSTELEVKIQFTSQMDPGTYNVIVYSGAKRLELLNSFQIVNPSRILYAIGPFSKRSITDMYIFGENTTWTQGTNSVKFSNYGNTIQGINTGVLSVVNDTQIRIKNTMITSAVTTHYLDVELTNSISGKVVYEAYALSPPDSCIEAYSSAPNYAPKNDTTLTIRIHLNKPGANWYWSSPYYSHPDIRLAMYRNGQREPGFTFSTMRDTAHKDSLYAQMNIAQNTPSGTYDLMIDYSDSSKYSYYSPMFPDIYYTSVDTLKDAFILMYPTGINKISVRPLAVFPNPASDHITIPYNEKTGIISQLTFTDIAGKTVYVVSGNFDSDLVLNRTDMKLPTGIYVLTANSNTGVFTQKIILE